ncbi:hypothetical protein QF046_002631 [Microbacterium sp. W4I4]|uniref:hypothetical protein n=1 Tax=Microbacterium sp. W4I4 TaxID=3042295 RepID=UPI0027819D54|nr:hypothetical protein [Microbacterium sp. W4I4]MDQ0614990.1 hypothetical protein [Microbacterium sp. W4I4]
MPRRRESGADLVSGSGAAATVVGSIHVSAVMGFSSSAQAVAATDPGSPRFPCPPGSGA